MKYWGSNCLFILFVVWLCSVPLMAQTVVSVPSDVKLTLSCRLHWDVGVYGGDSGNVHSGSLACMAKISDVRLGIKVTHKGLLGRLEGRFDNSNASITDTYLRYSFGKNSIQFGNYWMPFGYRTLSPSFHYIRNASVDDVLDANSRKVGILFRHTGAIWRIATGFSSDTDANNFACNKGINFVAKNTWRPIDTEKQVLHLALAVMFTKSPQALSFKVKSLTQGNVVTFFQEDIVGDAYRNVSRMESEVIYLFGKLYLEECFQAGQVKMKDGVDRGIYGFFVQPGWLIRGEKQKYNRQIGYTANLEKGSLEVSARWGYVDFYKGWDKRNRQSDMTLGLNYAFTNYIMMKLNLYHSFGNGYSSCELRTQVVI